MASRSAHQRRWCCVAWGCREIAGECPDMSAGDVHASWARFALYQRKGCLAVSICIHAITLTNYSVLRFCTTLLYYVYFYLCDLGYGDGCGSRTRGKRHTKANTGSQICRTREVSGGWMSELPDRLTFGNFPGAANVLAIVCARTLFPPSSQTTTTP